MNWIVALEIGKLVLRILQGLNEAKADGKITKDEAVDILKDVINVAGYEGKIEVQDDDTRVA